MCISPVLRSMLEFPLSISTDSDGEGYWSEFAKDLTEAKDKKKQEEEEKRKQQQEE